MAKERFNVGDKVVLRDHMSRIQGNNIGTVKELLTRKLLPPGVIVNWRVNGGVNGGVNTSFYLLEEIKHVCQKGKQLLFDFMY